MLKHLMTLARGRATDSSQAFLDANGLALLRQQIRDAARGVEKHRKALAVVMAYAKREDAALARINDQISDLEGRALDALAQDREDLALDAATTISRLEAERDITQKAIETYQSKISDLRKGLTENEACLRAMKRGQHLVEASATAQRISGVTPSSAMSDLQEAQETLTRLQDRQEHTNATASAMMSLSVDDSAESVAKRLAEAGCGEPMHSDASSVLKRLKDKAAK